MEQSRDEVFLSNDILLGLVTQSMDSLLWENQPISGQIAFQIIFGNSRKLRKLTYGDELSFFLLSHLTDFADYLMTVALTATGNPLDVFGIDYTTFDIHGQLKIKVTKNWILSEKK